MFYRHFDVFAWNSCESSETIILCKVRFILLWQMTVVAGDKKRTEGTIAPPLQPTPTENFNEIIGEKKI